MSTRTATGGDMLRSWRFLQIRVSALRSLSTAVGSPAVHPQSTQRRPRPGMSVDRGVPLDDLPPELCVSVEKVSLCDIAENRRHVDCRLAPASAFGTATSATLLDSTFPRRGGHSSSGGNVSFAAGAWNFGLSFVTPTIFSAALRSGFSIRCRSAGKI